MWYFAIAILGAVVVASAASSRGRSGLGWFIYGLLLWPIALIHVLVLPRNDSAVEQARIADGSARACPHCAELVKREARLCKHCHQAIEPLAAQQDFA